MNELELLVFVLLPALVVGVSYCGLKVFERVHANAYYVTEYYQQRANQIRVEAPEAFREEAQIKRKEEHAARRENYLVR